MKKLFLLVSTLAVFSCASNQEKTDRIPAQVGNIGSFKGNQLQNLKLSQLDEVSSPEEFKEIDWSFLSSAESFDGQYTILHFSNGAQCDDAGASLTIIKNNDKYYKVGYSDGCISQLKYDKSKKTISFQAPKYLPGKASDDGKSHWSSTKVNLYLGK